MIPKATDFARAPADSHGARRPYVLACYSGNGVADVLTNSINQRPESANHVRMLSGKVLLLANVLLEIIKCLRDSLVISLTLQDKLPFAGANRRWP